MKYILPKFTLYSFFPSIFVHFVLVHLFIFAMGLNAAVTLRIKAGALKDESGSVFPTTGLVVVVVSPTNGEFAGPDSRAFANDDDFVLDAFDLSSTGIAGLFIETIANLNLMGTLGPGDPVAVYWFPTITKAEYVAGAVPSVGDPYGFYSSSLFLSGAAPWVIPPDGGTITLDFLTDDAAFNVYAYDGEAYAHAASAGNASYVVPVAFGDGSSSEVPLPPALFTNDTQVNDNSDWYGSDWFGYYNSLERPWYFHQDLGFVYIPAGQSEDNLWLWSVLLNDWLWTRHDLWPYAYQLSGEWLFYHHFDGASYFYSFNGEPAGWK